MTDVQGKVGSGTGGRLSRMFSQAKEPTSISAASTKILIDQVGHVGQIGATILMGFHLTRGRCCFHLVVRTGPAKCMTSELEGTKASQAPSGPRGMWSDVRRCPNKYARVPISYRDAYGISYDLSHAHFDPFFGDETCWSKYHD